jgi:hypothetical protein
MSGGRSTIDVQADLSPRCIVHDVVVVRNPKQDLIAGNRVRNNDRAMTAARLISQPALVMAANPGLAFVRRQLA